MVIVMAPSLDIGGLSSMAVAISEASQNFHDTDCKIITLYKADQSIPGIASYSLEKGRRSRLRPKFIVALNRIYRFFKISNQLKPTRIICLDTSSLFIAVICGFFSGNYNVSGGLFTPKSMLSRSDKFIIRFIYPLTDRVLVPSEGMKKELFDINPKIKVKVVPNILTSQSLICPVEKNTFDQARGRPRIVFVGRLSLEKDPTRVLEIAQERQNYFFEIYGNGPLHDDLIEKIAERSIENVFVGGWGDVSKVMNGASALILPSKAETFGIVIIEAWMHRLPVIANASAYGPQQLISHYPNAGLLVQSDSTEIWASTLDKVLQLSISDDHLANILQEFHPSKIVSEWL